ncbi:hypothetical protein, partial [Burkholderia sp. SIMBA_048]|uniref:hypothetical protein n=1 Tax=Burkholderia sp. SIMBA_048 TaxID=3085789 RepID=UPI00397D3F2B
MQAIFMHCSSPVAWVYKMRYAIITLSPGCSKSNLIASEYSPLTADAYYSQPQVSTQATATHSKPRSH